MNEFRIVLGVIVRDRVTGFLGRVTGRVQYMTGCNQYLVQPEPKGTGWIEARWFDEHRLDRG